MYYAYIYAYNYIGVSRDMCLYNYYHSPYQHDKERITAVLATVV